MEILILLALFLANGVFAMSELAMVSSRRIRLQQLAEAGDAGARAALDLRENPGRFLSTIQVGITLIGILAGAYGEAALVADLQPYIERLPLLAPYARQIALGLIVVGITFGSLIVGELVPKRLAMHAPEAIARRVSRPMHWLAQAMSPFVRLLTTTSEGVLWLFGVRERVEETVTEAEIEGLMKAGAEAGVFEQTEREFVSRVLRLDAQPVAVIMTPRVDIVYIDLEHTLDENLKVLHQAGYTRLPVCRGGLGDVLGVLDGKDLLEPALRGNAVDFTAHLRPALFVPDTINVVRLLELFKQHHGHLALVVDEYGEVQGLATMTDVLEAIVGDVPDSDEPVEPDIVRRADGSFLVDGSTPLARVGERSLEPPAEDAGAYHTLGGLVMARLGRVPKTGDHFDYAGLRFEVLDMDRHRVDKVLVAPRTQLAPRGEPPSAAS
jgi:putative hemolysin